MVLHISSAKLHKLIFSFTSCGTQSKTGNWSDYKSKGYGNASSSDQLSQSCTDTEWMWYTQRKTFRGTHVYNMIMWELESIRGSFMCTVCTVVSMCISVPFWTWVCVSLFLGWRVIAWVVIRGCVREGMLFWSRMRQNERERSGEKFLQQTSKYQPPVRVLYVFPNWAPSWTHTHKHTLSLYFDLPLQHTHTHTHLF